MPRFDRYMLGQFLTLFGFFSLLLVSIYWINRAVALFDQLIANGQTALVFLEFTALSLPNVIRVVLPMAAFAASVYVGNRLSSDSELVVVQATGYSPFRLARPALYFALIVATLVSVLTHVLVPAAAGELARRQGEVDRNITARFLSEGQFLHPAEGITFYIREISPDGELHDVLLSDTTTPGERTIYTARRALIVRTQGEPRLLMFEGIAQTLRLSDRRLAVTRFADFAFDIGALIDTAPGRRRSIYELPSWRLFSSGEALIAEGRATPGQLALERNTRFSQATLAVVAALAGFSVLLVGSFSRFGLWRQITGGIVFLVLVKSLDNAMADMVRRNADLWPLAYLASAAGLLVCWLILAVAARPALFRRRARLMP